MSAGEASGPSLSASVVMPTFNKAGYLDLTLASYSSQRCRDFEVLISDDGSTDETSQIVEKYRERFDIKYIRRENRGRSAARNAALELAEGDVVIFADDDRVVSPEFVEAHLREHESSREDKYVIGWQYGILTSWRSEIRHDPRVLQFLLTRPGLAEKAQIGQEFWLASAADVERDLLGVLTRLRLVEPWWESRCVPIVETFSEDLSGFRLAWFAGTTGNMSVTREKLKDAGWFDPAFHGWGLEDHELCYRLSRSKAVARISREAVNYHQVHPRAPTVFAEWDRNLQHFMQKHQSIDIVLLRLWIHGRNPVELDNISRECEALRAQQRDVLIEELRRLYGVLDGFGKLCRSS